MGNFINVSGEKRRALAFSVLEQMESGGEIEMTDITSAVSQLLNQYHNQVCEPDALWIAREEIEAMPKLLRLLADGIEQVEKIEK